MKTEALKLLPHKVQSDFDRANKPLLCDKCFMFTIKDYFVIFVLSKIIEQGIFLIAVMAK